MGDHRAFRDLQLWIAGNVLVLMNFYTLFVKIH